VDTERQSALWNAETDSASLAEADELKESPDEEIAELDDLNEARAAMNDVLVEVVVDIDSSSAHNDDVMEDWRSAHSATEQYEEGIETANDGDTEECPD
jgi:hypothetical protein